SSLTPATSTGSSCSSVDVLSQDIQALLRCLADSVFSLTTSKRLRRSLGGVLHFIFSSDITMYGIQFMECFVLKKTSPLLYLMALISTTVGSPDLLPGLIDLQLRCSADYGPIVFSLTFTPVAFSSQSLLLQLRCVGPSELGVALVNSLPKMNKCAVKIEQSNISTTIYLNYFAQIASYFKQDNSQKHIPTGYHSIRYRIREEKTEVFDKTFLQQIREKMNTNPSEDDKKKLDIQLFAVFIMHYQRAENANLYGLKLRCFVALYTEDTDTPACWANFERDLLSEFSKSADVEIHFLKEALETWATLSNNSVVSKHPQVQKSWDGIIIKHHFSSLVLSIPSISDEARFLALQEKEAEAHGVSDDGSTRRIDMIAFQDTNKGWIIDPTIRMESHAEQPVEVHNEKCSIYNATISYYKNKY
ncbi:hypothetical protein C0J52_20700, partial [Blattella germanica]